MNILEKLISTIIIRWYVFLFLAGYLFVAITHLGFKRCLKFSIIGFIVGLLADLSSTKNGFPFGLYHYTGLTSSKEIFINNVPVITALSFIFLSYIGYNIAIFIFSTLHIKKNDIQIVSNHEIDTSLRVCFTGSIIMMLIDVVIDPISVVGKKWFLGDFYWYAYPGSHFGIPFSNYIGWFIVGFLTIFLFQQLEKRNKDSIKMPQKGQIYIPFLGISCIIFYYSIFLFMMFIAYQIEYFEIISSSVITFIPLTILIISCIMKESNRAKKNDYEVHFKDYPSSPLKKITIN